MSDDESKKDVNDFSQYIPTELMVGYREQKANADSYSRLVVENADLREQISELESKLRKLNTLAIVLDSDPSKSRPTKIMEGKFQGLALCTSIHNPTYEEIETTLDGLEGYIAGIKEFQATLTKKISDRKTDAKAILEAKDTREKIAKEKDKYGKKVEKAQKGTAEWMVQQGFFDMYPVEKRLELAQAEMKKAQEKAAQK